MQRSFLLAASWSFRKLGCAVLAGCIALVGCSPSPVAVVTSDRSFAEKAASHADSEDRTDQALLARVDAVLESGLHNRRLSTEVNAAWQIFHAIICYGLELQVDTPDRGQVSALEYAFSNGQIRGFELRAGSTTLPTTGRPGVIARLEPGSYEGQGHVDQWIAICAMADIPASTPILIGEERFTVEDFARQAQYDVSKNLLNEFSWTLIALTHYFPEESTWTVERGTSVSWEMLVEEELRTGLEGAACGGTHRLAGIVRAWQAKQAKGLADSPVWTSAKQRIDEQLQRVREQRGPDGQLSAYYMISHGSSADLDAELASSGHLFEFLALACDRDQLLEPWVTVAANRLCYLLERLEDHDVDCGNLYHALSGLKIYRDRIADLAPQA